MHMADALLSPAVGGIMFAVSAGSIAYSVKKVRDDPLADKKVPVMAVSGAFIFAAQMINFTIPGTGSSGHLGGGILLAAMLGGGPALLAITAVLLIQCLFFADGGLLALGCNIFNMGVLPCLVVYPLVFKPLLQRGTSKGRITAAALISCVLGLQLGAFGVVLETVFSGISALPFGAFVLLMQPIHLAIGLVEGLVTAAVLCYINFAQPELISANLKGTASPFRIGKKVLIPLIIAALIAGGVLSHFASSLPDGLEWAIEKTAGTAELTSDGSVYDKAADLQNATAILPDYAYVSSGDDGSASGVTVAGVSGTIMTFALAGIAGYCIKSIRKRKSDPAVSK